MKAVVDAEVQIVGERGSEVEAGVRPCAEQAVEVGGHVPRDEATGPVEDLAPDRHAALGPFGDVVVHGNLGEVREDGQPLPVGEKALEGGPTARREAVLLDLPPGSGVHSIQNLEKGSIERSPGSSGIFRKSDQTVDVGPVKAGNEALPGVGPFAPVRKPGPGFHEVSAGMGPAEAENDSRLDAGRGLVGRIAVNDQEALEILEVRLGNGGAPGGVEDEDDGIDRQKAPEPPSVALFPLDLLENLKSRLVRVGEGGRPGACEKRLVKGKVKTGDPDEGRVDRPRRQDEPRLLPERQDAAQRSMEGILSHKNFHENGNSQESLGNKRGRSRSRHDPRGAGTGAGLPVAFAMVEPTIGPHVDLDRLLGLLSGERHEGKRTSGTDLPVGRKVDLDMDGRELGAGFPTDARMSLLMAAAACRGGRERLGSGSLSPPSLLALFPVKILVETPVEGLEFFDPGFETLDPQRSGGAGRAGREGDALFPCRHGCWKCLGNQPRD